jgi:3'-5' exoribonuclease
MFPEALMLHYLDDLDSKMESMRAHFEREAENDSSWTTYNASLGRTLLNTAKFLRTDEPIAAAAAASAAENVITVNAPAGNGNGSQLIEPVPPLIDEVS